jgi:predicted house-cleaning noncanonical NTP pyrophosphatase (MazG superfamily)
LECLVHLQKDSMKLIRDKIPEIVAAKGETIRTRQAGPEERWRLLKEKLVEEATELRDTPPASDEEIEELADIIEVMRHLCDDIELSEPGKLAAAYQKKLLERGEVGFTVLLEDDDT